MKNAYVYTYLLMQGACARLCCWMWRHFHVSTTTLITVETLAFHMGPGCPSVGFKKSTPASLGADGGGKRAQIDAMSLEFG